jgi:hypothetical protein
MEEIRANWEFPRLASVRTGSGEVNGTKYMKAEISLLTLLLT